jgi:ABC-type dipeptide/oligopeptide/nickel transport system permease component
VLRYAARRVLATVPVMAVVALFVFSLLYIAPGDPAASGGEPDHGGSENYDVTWIHLCLLVVVTSTTLADYWVAG